MLEVRRLLAVGTLLSLAALFTYAHVRGEPGREKEVDRLHPNTGQAAQKADKAAWEKLVESRFARVPFGTYKPEDKGDQFFWLQLQPKLPDAPALPRDVLVLVDTSASKAQGPLALAQEITRQLVKGKKPGPGPEAEWKPWLSAEGRVAVWTVNTAPHDLSRAFRAPADPDDALKDLSNEFPAGAVNLKAALGKAVD